MGTENLEGRPPEGSHGTKPPRWTAASVVALLGSLIAALIPVTQVIQGWRDNNLKKKELEQKITMEFLKLRGRAAIGLSARPLR